VVPDLEDIYDEATLARLGAGHPRRVVQGVAGAPAAAVVTALTLGMREAVSPERPPEEIIEEVDLAATQLHGSEAVRVAFVPQAPRLTRAYVRPWLRARIVVDPSCSSTTSNPARS
jgi:hypothetical protein